jgi:hypothetical protein
MLVCMGIAEIREHAVAHVLRDKAAVALDRFGAAAMISADDPPQFLGVEPNRQRRGAHEIAEHYRELAPLGEMLRLRVGRGRGLRRRGPGKLCYRCQDSSPMPEQDADVLEILIGQMAQIREINTVLGEGLSILPQREFFQPFRDRLHSGPRSPLPDFFVFWGR